MSRVGSRTREIGVIRIPKVVKETTATTTTGVDEAAGNLAVFGPASRSGSDPIMDLIQCGLPATSTAVVGGRLLGFWQRWERMGASKTVVGWLRHGLTLDFSLSPPLTSVPVFMDSYQHDLVKREALRLAMEELIEKAVLEEVHEPNSPGFYGRLFIRPKPDGRWRTIIDLSELNKFIVNPSFQMETAKSIQESMRKGMWAATIDLSDAYYHVPIHPRYRKYMRVALFGKVLQFRAMPMGLNVSARVFTKICTEVMRFLRPLGYHVHAYIDDWKVKNRTEDLVNFQTPRVVALCDFLGLMKNLKKSVLEARQVYGYIGVWYNLVIGLAQVPLDRITDLEDLVRLTLEQGRATARTWSRIIGKMGSMADQIRTGALHRRPVQRLLQIGWDQLDDNWEAWVPVEQWVIPHLKWWLNRENTLAGVPLEPFKPDVTMYTDASKWGFGATLGDLHISRQWTLEEAQSHSNNLEMIATIRALKEFKFKVRGKAVLICSDNTTTVATINHQGGTKSWSLTELAWQFWDLADSLKCNIVARHIPGNLNVQADALSRQNQVVSTEWSLLPEVLDPVWEKWGRPEVDLFATNLNNVLPIYVSPMPDPRAWKVNALTFSWNGFYSYAFPPWPLIGKVLQKVETDQAEIILIAPNWKARPWYPLLLELATEPPLPLPQRADLLRQPHNNSLCQNVELFQLHAWRLSGTVFKG